MMKAKELKNLSVEELDKKLDELKKDLFMLRMQHATNQLDNPMRLAAVKKDIARIKTIIREKESQHLRRETSMTEEYQSFPQDQNRSGCLRQDGQDHCGCD